DVSAKPTPDELKTHRLANVNRGDNNIVDQMPYYRLPYEVNARMSETFLDISKYIKKALITNSLITHDKIESIVRAALRRNNLLDIFTDKDKRVYNRLLSRAAQYYENEKARLENPGE